MKRPQPWRWGEPGVVFERETDDGDELVWINARLPPPPERARYGLRVEVLCWFATLDVMNAGLVVLHDYFQADSLLAALRRRDDATRILLYTAAREPFVQDRYVGVRAVLRPTAIGLRVAAEPAWESFIALAEPHGIGRREPMNEAV